MKQALDFIKANLTALLCGVVALAAIIALFVWPVPGMFAELRTEVEARKATHDSITSLSSANRTLPSFDPAVNEPVPLAGFPNKDVIAAGKKAVLKMQDEAKSTLAAVVKLNEMTPLVANALPKTDSFARTDFFNAYRIASAQYGENAERGVVRTVLHGTLPPTPEELTNIENQRSNEIRKNNLQTNARGEAQNQPQVDALIADMKAKLGVGERVRRAENYQIYVSPGAIEVHPAMVDVSVINPVTIFNAQFSLWVQTAVMSAIADANAGSKNVLDAPVKHLLMLKVPMNIADPSAQPQGFGGQGGGGAPEPNAAAVELTPNAAATITPNTARDPLGYTSNAMYDSINVQMTLRLDATKMTDALAALSKNHLIKIRNVSFHNVDLGIALSQGYFYSIDGKTPVVEVDLDCDVLFLREWLVKYMPDPVKTVFNGLANPTAAAQ